MTDIYRPSNTTRSVLAAVGVLALALGLLAYAPSAQGQTPPPQSADGEASTAQANSPINLNRHAGPTRYETSAQTATDAYDASTDVVIASGEDFADALSGAALEGMLDAPVLLVPSDLVNGAIPTATTDAIDDLGATSATVLGGEVAVSSGVVDYIENNSTVQSTERVAGATRYETAEQIAGEVGSAGPIPDAVADEFGLTQGSQAAFVATGVDFPDALAAGPGAFAGQHPILLTGPDELHPAAVNGLEAAGAETVFILGGTDAVGSGVESALQDEGYETQRLSGATRWDTAKAVADTFADDWGYGVQNVGLATGHAFADALSSAPFLGNPAPLVLTPNDDTVAATSTFFDERGCDVQTIDIFGGQAAVQSSVAESYAETACSEEEPGEADLLELTPQSVTNPTTGLDDDGVPDPSEPSEHTVTAAVTDTNGDPVADGQQVRFEVYDRANQDNEAFAGAVETTTDGDVDFTYEFETDPDEDGDDERSTADGGQDIIVACTVPDTTTPCVEDDVLDFDPVTGDVRNIVPGVNDTAEKAWEQREAQALTLTPETAVNLSEETHTVTASLTDQFGDPADPSALADQDVGFTVLDGNGDVDSADNVETFGDDPGEAFNEAQFSYTGPTVNDSSERADHRIIACEDETDYQQCLDDGDIASGVFADDAAKQWVEVTGETTVQLNWQNEFRTDADAWGGVDDVAAAELSDDGNGTVDLRFNSDLGIVRTDGQVQVSSAIPADGTPAGPNFHLHAGAIDAEGGVEIALPTPELVSPTDPDERELRTYDLTGMVQDEDAASVLGDIESAMDDDDGEVIDWYLNVHTVDNPAGEVRGQLQDIAGTGASSADGGLSQIPSVYKQVELTERSAGDDVTIQELTLTFDENVDAVTDQFGAPLLGELEPEDFTAAIDGTEVPVQVQTDLDNSLQAQLVLRIAAEVGTDADLSNGDDVTVAIEDSGLQKLTTEPPSRNGIGDDDLTRSWDERSFTFEDVTAPQAQSASFTDSGGDDDEFGNDDGDNITVQYDEAMAVSSGATITVDPDNTTTGDEVTYTCGTDGVTCSALGTTAVSLVSDGTTSDAVTLTVNAEVTGSTGVTDTLGNAATGYPVSIPLGS